MGIIMSKVYCKNCKYYWNRAYQYIGYVPVSDVCLKKSIVYTDAIGDKRVKNIVDCTIVNKNNDCKDYKRKWYKFWVK